jgi:hypothetical protein
MVNDAPRQRWWPSRGVVLAGRAWPYAVLVLAWLLWIVGIGGVAVDRMTDLGLVSVLPWQIFVSLAVLSGGAMMLLREERPNPVAMTFYVLTLVFLLYAIPAVVEQVAHFSVNWVHEGFIEYIRRTGAVAPQLEARFDWPGFFILAAFLAEAAGIGRTVDFANWAPVYFNLAYLLALAVIFRSQTRDPRLVWAGLWVFALGNWIGQDYFAPQALAYFLDLVIIGVVLTWFRVAQPRSQRTASWILARGRRASQWGGQLYELLTPEAEPARPARGETLAALVLLLVMIFAFIAYSHQLTPFFLTAALLGLAILNRLSARNLPLIFGVITVAWISYMTVPFLQGHVVSLLNEVGRLGDTVGTNVVQRIQGSRDHQFIVLLRLGFTLTVWAVAAIGAVVRFRDGRRDLSLIVLAIAPVPLVGLQAYGGELVLRLYLFTLPIAAFMVAGLVYGRPRSAPTRLHQGLAIIVCLGLIGMFFVTRYGNERADLMRPTEVQAVEKLYAMAPHGSLLVAASNNLPWMFQDFERYTYLSPIAASPVGEVGTLAAAMRDPKYPAAFLILTRSQGNYAEVFFGLAPGAWDTFVADVRSSPLFTEVYRNPDADIFVPVGQGTSGVVQ